MRRGVVALVIALAAAPAFFAACSSTDEYTVQQNVTWGSRGGTPLTADIYTPVTTNKIRKPKRPAIVLIHGGAWESGDKADVAGTAQGFAAAGFVAVSINYAIPPPGRRFRAEVDDCKAAVVWVQQHASDLGVDPDRVGVYGSSAGGNLAMMVGVEGTGNASLPAVKAVASWSGISDLTTLAPPDGKPHPENPPPGCGDYKNCMGVLTPQWFTDYLGCTLQQCPARYSDASPVTHVTETSPPMYLAAFSKDFVPYSQSVEMHDALRRFGVTSELQEVPGEGHAEQLRTDALDPTVSFFKQHLRA